MSQQLSVPNSIAIELQLDDKGESEASITVSLDMVPNKFSDVNSSVVTSRPRGVTYVTYDMLSLKKKFIRSKLNKIFQYQA